MLMATRKFKIEPRTEEAGFLYSSPKMTANPMGLYFEKRTSPISVTPSPGPIGVPKTEKAFMHESMGQHALTNRTEQSL